MVLFNKCTRHQHQVLHNDRALLKVCCIARVKDRKATQLHGHAYSSINSWAPLIHKHAKVVIYIIIIGLFPKSTGLPILTLWLSIFKCRHFFLPIKRLTHIAMLTRWLSIFSRLFKNDAWKGAHKRNLISVLFIKISVPVLPS